MYCDMICLWFTLCAHVHILTTANALLGLVLSILNTQLSRYTPQYKPQNKTKYNF